MRRALEIFQFYQWLLFIRIVLCVRDSYDRQQPSRRVWAEAEWELTERRAEVDGVIASARE